MVFGPVADTSTVSTARGDGFDGVVARLRPSQIPSAVDRLKY